MQKEEAVQEPPAGQEPAGRAKPSTGQEPSAEQEPPAESMCQIRERQPQRKREIYSVRVSIEINGYFSTEDFRIEDADGEVTVEDAIDFAIKEKELTELEEGWQYSERKRMQRCSG